LREQKAPFVPELDSETDAGYFDDFGNEADMAKYKEVHEKQAALEAMQDRNVQMGKGLFVGCECWYKHTLYRLANMISVTFRHKKPTEENGKPASPRKPLPMVDENFGTIF
jgi:cell cycle protein kinase DBF2